MSAKIFNPAQFAPP